MREILFRGKTLSGKWVEGFFLIRKERYKGDKTFMSEEPIISLGICESSGAYAERTEVLEDEVIPETVGQFTGLTVPSGKIFEHDVVTAKFKSNGARFNFTVKYSNEKGCYVFDNGSVKVPFNDIRSVRIIGNTHDNPELLGGDTNV